MPVASPGIIALEKLYPDGDIQIEAAAETSGETIRSSITPFTVWAPSQFLEYVEPEGAHFLLPKYLSRKEITSVIGPPGVGKSRAVLWLTICQILQRLWCEILTGGGAQRWLILGDENSVGRLKDDLTKMLSCLSEDERVHVEDNLRIQAVLSPEDGDLDLADDMIAIRVIETIQRWPPGVVVFDPLASFYSGDLSKPGEMKIAVRHVIKTVAAGAALAAIIVIHHARTGRANAIQAVGFDSGNFAAGGKALLARSRCQINLVEADELGTGNILIACGKANNCPKFSPRAANLDPKTMTYAVDPGFDLDRWKAELEGRSKSGEGLLDLKSIVEAVRDGYAKAGQLKSHFLDVLQANSRTVERRIQKAVKFQYLAQIRRGEYCLGKKANHLLDTN